MNFLTRLLPAGRTARLQGLSLLLALVTVVTYWPVRHHDFINLDDHLYVYSNEQVQLGLTWAGLGWAFTNGQAFNWHPLTWLSHMLDVQLFGVNPGPHHLVSVFIHAANAVLLLLVLTRLTGVPGRSALVAALFALHPTHVESVAWIAERKDVLSTLFWLLTMGAYLRYTERPSRCRYALVVVGFVLGLMCKPMVVTLPFVLLLLDYWPLRRWQPRPATHSLPGQGGADAGSTPSAGDPSVAGEKEQSIPGSLTPSDSGAVRLSLAQLVWEKWPLFVLTAVFCVVTYILQREDAVVSVAQISFRERVLNALLSYAAYVGKTLWPANLSVFYPYPATWPVGKVVVAAVFLIGISTWVVRRVRSAPYLLVGWCWYLGTLVPVIGLVQVGEQALADRYTYVPTIGLFIMLVWWIGGVTAGKHREGLVGRIWAAAVLVAFAVATRGNLGYWQDSSTLFKRALQVTTDNHVAHVCLGNYWTDHGRLDEAMRHFSQALSIKPDRAEIHFNLANTLAKQGRLNEAMERYQQALRLKPNYPQAHFNMANALARHGNANRAVAEYAEALRLDPNYLEAHLNLGNLFLAQDKATEAITQFESVLNLKPSHAGARNNLGNALAKQGKLNEAAKQYAEAIRAQPDYVEAHINLGATLADQGRTAEAMAAFHRALGLDERQPRIHNELGLLLANQGRIPEAVECYDKALRLRPDYVEAHVNLGFALMILGRLDQAVTHYNEAIRLKPKDAKSYSNLGYVRLKQGQTAAAAQAFGRAVELQSDLAPALNGLAWILATAADPKIRDGSRAVQLAQRACELAHRREPLYLQTLAAALAENSRFEEAATVARAALAVAQQTGNASLAVELNEHLRRYESREAIRDGHR